MKKTKTPVAAAAPSKPGPKPKLVHSETLIDQIRTFGKIQCTVEEVAAVLKVSLRTLQNFFAVHEDAKEAHEDGKLEGYMSLRRKQFLMAEKNCAMAIWLGKQYLGQREPVREIEVGKPGDFDALDDSQLLDEITQQTRELAEIDPEFARELGRKATTKH